MIDYNKQEDERIAVLVKSLETSKPHKRGMYLSLFHGRKDPKQEMDDWGEDGPMFGPLLSVGITYNSTICLMTPDGDLTGPLCPGDVLCFKGDMLYYDGMYYGDWSVTFEE